MKTIFRVEKIKIHNDNMDFVGTKIRIKIFDKTILTIANPTQNNQLKVI